MVWQLERTMGSGRVFKRIRDKVFAQCYDPSVEGKVKLTGVGATISRALCLSR